MDRSKRGDEDMARPAKSTKVLSDYSQTKDEIKAREEAERKLRAEGLPDAPGWLNDRQSEIYENIVGMLDESGMIGLNDGYLLCLTSIAIERLEEIEKRINKDKKNIYDRDLMSARTGYMRDFYRGCNELCLSPQARAKVANIVSSKEKKKPLEEIVSEADGL